jgi:hypothetical protein
MTHLTKKSVFVLFAAGAIIAVSQANRGLGAQSAKIGV